MKRQLREQRTGLRSYTENFRKNNRSNLKIPTKIQPIRANQLRILFKPTGFYQYCSKFETFGRRAAHEHAFGHVPAAPQSLLRSSRRGKMRGLQKRI
jgi:hypothetical protein